MEDGWVTTSQSRIFFEKKDEGSSRIKNSLNGYFKRRTGSGTKWRNSQSRIFFEKKDEAFTHKKNSNKPKILSRMSRFTRDEAIQLKAKFALANLIKWK